MPNDEIEYIPSRGRAEQPTPFDYDRIPTHDAIAYRLATEVPEFAGLASAVVSTLVPVLRAFYRSGAPQALGLIVNQAFNDFRDLLTDLEDGRGRPASRAARALVEHAVNYATVASDAEANERYVAHSAIAARIEAEAAIGLQLLRGNEQRSEQHRLRKLGRDASGPAQSATGLYGSAFARNWASANLRDRADQHGLSDLYSYYRLSSMVLHGAAGGSAGTVSTRYEHLVHRTGLALTQCIYAFHEGVRAFQAIMRQVADRLRETATANAISSLESLLDTWPAYRRAIISVDEALWPAEAPIGPLTILAVARSGARRWYYYDTELGLIAEASAPDPTSIPVEQRDRVEQTISEALPTLDIRDHWLTVVLVNVHVTPLPGAAWMNPASVLVPTKGSA